MSTRIFEDTELLVQSLAVSDMDNRAYLISHRASGAQILIDAADDAPALREYVSAGTCEAGELVVATTHQHWDHTRALPAFAGARLVAGAEDADAIEAQRGVRISTRLAHGDTVSSGPLTLEVIALRGHTPGSVAFALRRPEATLLFTGDSLFPGGVGNTEQDPQRFSSLLTDVTERLFGVFDDAAQVLPGHGEPTTLGRERAHLTEWKERGW
ncbi:MBL fold metallo-hydrolase [Galactobacter caseinivorans]|uniref:MBL fold metallo-hydrolase n=1 Tax=Galactobacter caseinivorans TaxID=2676123 RepID=A0A496PKM1_9MICC|nr:MBL fold metallo-hydrolase [Galactobacter caseinivorans]RKW71052.1 MBL fold metallo-hydrolase [Galactobacter caseinivorans]